MRQGLSQSTTKHHRNHLLPTLSEQDLKRNEFTLFNIPTDHYSWVDPQIMSMAHTQINQQLETKQRDRIKNSRVIAQVIGYNSQIAHKAASPKRNDNSCEDINVANIMVTKSKLDSISRIQRIAKFTEEKELITEQLTK